MNRQPVPMHIRMAAPAQGSAVAGTICAPCGPEPQVMHVYVFSRPAHPAAPIISDEHTLPDPLPRLLLRALLVAPVTRGRRLRTGRQSVKGLWHRKRV